MKNKAENCEILAPAGNADALQCAVQNGADAVYFGLEKFNARMKAENFTEENLPHWIDYCHLYGVRVYVALNTCVKENEFDEAVSLLHVIYDCNADGAILTDLPLIRYAAETFAGRFDIVASTQLNIHDEYGAKFVKELGATTVVAARETPLEKIAEMARTGIKVECFIHGALCVCQSGQCLFSSVVGGNSGNRGLCAQPCRQFYRAQADEKTMREGYLLSPKDLCGLDIAEELAESGVTVFKIEGRNRRAEYAGLTSAVYCDVLKNFRGANDADVSKLKRMYNRGDYLSDTYLRGRNDDIIYPFAPGHIGEKVGTVRGNVLFATEEVQKDDCFKLFIKGKEVGSARAAESGRRVKLIVNGVGEGADAHMTSDVSLLSDVRQARKTFPLSFCFEAVVGAPVSLTASARGCSVQVTSDFCAERAETMPLSEADVRRSLSKIGKTCYTISNIETKIDEVFLPISTLNALRRDAIERLNRAIIERYDRSLRRTPCRPVAAIGGASVDSEASFAGKTAIVCKDLAQFSAALRFSPDLFIVDIEELSKNSLSAFAEVAEGAPFYVDLPPFADLSHLADILPSGAGIVANNIGAVAFAREREIPFIGGRGLNVFNGRDADLILRQGAKAFFYSDELTIAECRAFPRENGYKFVRGDLKLMHVVHCPHKVCSGETCAVCTFSSLTYTDEKSNAFRFRRRRMDKCYFELLNGAILSFGAEKLLPFNYCLDFDEGAFEYIKDIDRGKDSSFSEKQPYTKGRLFRKIN